MMADPILDLPFYKDFFYQIRRDDVPVEQKWKLMLNLKKKENVLFLFFLIKIDQIRFQIFV